MKKIYISLLVVSPLVFFVDLFTVWDLMTVCHRREILVECNSLTAAVSSSSKIRAQCVSLIYQHKASIQSKDKSSLKKIYQNRYTPQRSWFGDGISKEIMAWILILQRESINDSKQKTNKQKKKKQNKKKNKKKTKKTPSYMNSTKLEVHQVFCKGNTFKYTLYVW